MEMDGSDYYWFILLGFIIVLLIALAVVHLKKSFINNLQNKAIVVTGCDSGFGLDLAQRLDKLGVTVFAGCLFPDGPGAQTLKSRCSENLYVLKLDVTDDDQVQDAVKTVKSCLREKELWGVINNAGIATMGFMEWMTIDIIKKIFDVNTLGPFRMTKAFLPLLRESKGRVVIVGSLAGLFPLQGCGAYSMSKYAVVSLSHTLRRELAQFNISVHLVNPGSYRTPILTRPIKEELQCHWNRLPEEIRSVYNEHCIESYEAEVLDIWKQFSKSESKVYEVTEAIIHAVLTKRPKNIYVPGLLAKLQFASICITPVPVVDYCSEAFLRFCSMLRKTRHRVDENVSQV